MTEPPSTAPVTRVTATVPPTAPELRCLGGRFDLLDHIGAGGGAVVVRARDRQFPGRMVAIKLLDSRDEDLRRRFVQEAEVLRAMDHPSIVRVLGRDIDGEEYYTVLELIEGEDLLEHLTHSSGPLPWRQVVDLGIQIASALEMVHRQGLVHRDVKPANIMFDAVGGRVKLIDFGVVRITENYRVPTGATPARRQRARVIPWSLPTPPRPPKPRSRGPSGKKQTRSRPTRCRPTRWLRVRCAAAKESVGSGCDVVASFTKLLQLPEMSGCQESRPCPDLMLITLQATHHRADRHGRESQYRRFLGRFVLDPPAATIRRATAAATFRRTIEPARRLSLRATLSDSARHGRR